MKRFPEIARRAVSLALAASMSLSVLAPCASAAVTARDLENSVDELGNVDLTDEVFNVPDDTAAKPEIRETTEEPEFPAVEDDDAADDLTEEQLAEQAVVDEAGHTEHTPDTDAEPVYEQPATCAERLPLQLYAGAGGRHGGALLPSGRGMAPSGRPRVGRVAGA